MRRYPVQSIVDRRTRNGRVQYLIKWEGYTDEENTWETRINLIKDGHEDAVKSFEKERRATSRGRSPGREKSPAKSKSRSTTPRRSRSRSTSKPAKGRKSPSSSARGRPSTKQSKQSESPLQEDETKPEASEESEPSKSTNENLDSPPKSAPKAKKSLESEFQEASAPPADVDGTEDTDDAEEVQQYPGIYEEVYDLIGRAQAHGLGFYSVGFFLIILAVLANILIPQLSKLDGTRNLGKNSLPIVMMTKTTSIPSVICLILVLHDEKSRNTYAKWIAVAIVWRTAGEVLLQLTSDIYYSWAWCSFGFAFFAFTCALCSIVGGSKPKGDILTQSLGGFGFLLLTISDWILFRAKDPNNASERFVIMTFSLMMLATSSLIKQRSK